MLFFAALCISFGLVSPHFLTFENLGAILVQSSWLIIVALGMNLVLLTAGVDLSVGAAMYLAAVIIGMGFGSAPAWVGLFIAPLIGAVFGAGNGLLVVKLRLPAFIATLAMTFVGRGLAIFLSSTKVVFAGPAVARLGRQIILGIPVPLIIAILGIALSWLLLRGLPFGFYVRSLGADTEGARRAGVPTENVIWSVYALCGAFAGLGGFISLSQSSVASSAFGQGAEFLAIAAAVLGGTSLFGGRGGLWAPVIGSVLIMTVQNGLVMINANPYAYPVVTATVIFMAAFLDSIRSGLAARLERRAIANKGRGFSVSAL
jgi:ribose transport system permease protein